MMNNHVQKRKGIIVTTVVRMMDNHVTFVAQYPISEAVLEPSTASPFS